MKKTVIKLLIPVLSIVIFSVFSLGLSNVGSIPDQTHVQNVTTDKSIDLTQFFTNDTISYSRSCDASKIVSGLTGSGLNQNFTFHPATNFQGSTNCNITATNSTGNSTLQNVKFQVIAQNPEFTLILPKVTWIKGVSNQIFVNATLANTGNVDLSFSAEDLTPLEELGNSSNNITFNSVSPTPACIVGSCPAVLITVGESEDRKFGFTNLDNVTSTNYTGTYNISLVSTFGEDIITKTATAILEVRDIVQGLQIPNKVTLGSNDQRRNVNATSSFTVTNTGDQDVSNLLISTDTDKKFKVQFSQASNSTFTDNLTISTLTPGETKTVFILGFIPADVSTGQDIDIGDILLQSLSLNKNFTISNFVINPVSQLIIEQVKVDYTDVDSDSRTKTVESQNQNVDKIKPDTKIEFEVRLENKFDSSSNIEFKKVDVDITIVDIDDGSDLDDDTDIDDIDAGNSEKGTITFQIPEDAARDDFEVKVRASAREKDSNAVHTATFNFKISIDRKQHDIIITRAELSNPTLSCNRNTILTVEVANQGRDEENRVTILSVSNDLDVNFRKKDIELTNDYADSDSRHRINIPIEISNDVSPGEYPIRTTVFFSDDIVDDIQDANLKVSECQPNVQAPANDDKASENVVVKSNTPTVEPPKATPPNAVLLDDDQITTKTTFRDTNAYTALLVLGILVLLLTLAFIALIYVRQIE